MNRSYLPFIDWLKCLGMLLILFGHLAGWARLAAFPPIYSKQFGVAFFLFASGYSLSRETRDRWHAAFNRLFEIYLFGVAVALLITIGALAAGQRAQLSNFLPFIAGVNVPFNNFPANPTSWYLGTYVHVILLWAIFSDRLRVGAGVLIVSLACEIALRALLIETAGSFVAYMLVSNWCTVFLLGYSYGQRRVLDSPSPRLLSNVWFPVALVASVAVWLSATSRLPFEPAFPFMRLTMGPIAGSVLVSGMVSMVYIGMTWLVFSLVKPWPAPWPVRFIARNTLLIFLGHMPVLFVIEPAVATWTNSMFARSAIYFVVCLPGLALVSEGLHRLIPTRELRDRVYVRLRAAVGGDTQVEAQPQVR